MSQLTIVDLFAGAGGLSTGIAQACEDLRLEPGTDVELHAVNHWEPAIETHEENHPWAEHYHDRIENLYPPNVVDPGSVTLLAGGPECTHFSTARGGKPVSDQKRASAWHVLDWIEKLQPEHVLLENVSEFRKWGPIEDGEPTKDGSIFERWIGILEGLGYSVVYDDEDEDYGVVLDAADYGDPQSRERLFIMASKSKLPTAPPREHSDDPDDDLPRRRPAADIIDWSDLGHSLFTRDLEKPRVTPLKQSTMARIAEGIRRHCSDRLNPFADAIERIGKQKDREEGKDVILLDELRERVVPVEYADVAAEALDEPFLVRIPGGGDSPATPSLVKYYGTSSVRPTDDPIDTVTADGNHHALSVPWTYLIGQHSGSSPQHVDEAQVPTVTTTSRGIALCGPDALLLGQHGNSIPRNVHDRPSPTVATGGKIQLYSPSTFCLRQQSGGVPVPTVDPLSTVSSGGAISVATVESRTLLQPRDGVQGDAEIAYDPSDRPHHVVIASDTRQGHILTPSLVRYSHGGRSLSVDDPMPTVATEKGGCFALSSPYLCPLYNSFPGQRPRTREVDRPLMTVTAKKGAPACLATPFLVEYYGNSDATPVDDPIPTVTTKDRFALCVPEEWPWGLDVRYRMLQPDELKQAQGFPEDYEITGSSKKTRTAQIGNAVPVNLARSLARHLLEDETPSLSNFGGGIGPDPDVDVPGYEEVTATDD